MAKVTHMKHARGSATVHPEEKEMLELPGTSPRQNRGSQASLHFDDQAVEVENVGTRNEAEMSQEVKWIRKNIKKRVCIKFIEKANYKDRLPPVRAPNSTHGESEAIPEDPLCFCGFKKSQHSPNAKISRPSLEERWDYTRHTTTQRTDAFGDIEFTGFGDRVGKYVRMDVETEMEKVQDLLLNVWGLDKPNVLISVTGGAKNFQMKGKLKEVFCRDITKAALCTGAWIITGGYNAGVMKHVGEAVRDYGFTSDSSQRVIAIGIAPWGCVQDKQSLQDERCNGKWPAPYMIFDSARKESFLDCNHTHFILVDNGTQHQYGVELPFRSKLEKAITCIKPDIGSDEFHLEVFARFC